MKKLDVKKRKQGGFILTSELILIVTIMVIGMIVGLVTMRDAITAEMEDVAEAVGAIDQSYSFEGMINGELSATVAGSAFGDDIDTNAGDELEWNFVITDGSELTTIATGVSAASSSAAVPGLRLKCRSNCRKQSVHTDRRTQSFWWIA